MITMREVGMISLMDHSPGQGQYRTEQAFREYVSKSAGTSSMEIDALIALKRAQSVHIPGRIERVTQLAREAELGIATHDDDRADKVAQWPNFGVTVSEFPTTMEAAHKAHELGLAVCMGAPNVLYKENILPLPQAIKLITLNPAQAVRLGQDFGSLERGKIADIILVNVNRQGLPYTQHMFVGGQQKFVRR